MPLHPDAESLLRNASAFAFPAEAATDPDAAAAYLQVLRDGIASTAEPELVARVYDTAIDDDVTVRVYAPDLGTPAPVLVYFHGGGWVSGNLDMHDSTCRQLANVAECIVVSVDYRLAPEHPFPTPLDDCFRATIWVHQHASEIGGDPQRIGVAGSSSGANLAAAVCLKALAAGGPAICQQALIYPVLDASMTTESYERNGEGYFLTASQMQWFWDQYVPDSSDRSNPLVSPSRADRLDDLPPAIVLVAEYDPLRDEGLEYSERLRSAGVPTDLIEYAGQIHGFVAMPSLITDARPAVDQVAALVRRNFSGA